MSFSWRQEKKLVYWKTVRAHVGKIIARQGIYFQFLPISFSQSLSTCVCTYGTCCAVRLSVWAPRTKWKWAASRPADTEALNFCCTLSGQWEDDICVGLESVKTLPCHFLSLDPLKPEPGNKVGESRRGKMAYFFFNRFCPVRSVSNGMSRCVSQPARWNVSHIHQGRAHR